MATISKWEPFGVALDITATVASVTRTSASKYSVKFNVSWKTYWDGAETNFGMKASAGGASVVINAFGNYASSGSGTVTGTYDISGNGAATKSVNVAFQNYECDWQGNITSSKSNSIPLSVSVPAWTSYTVSYNANGGSGAPSAQTKWKDQALTLSSTVPSRTGHTFKGWATSASGSVAYSAGGSYTANANVTLYAVWQAYTYTVSYNANGGSGAPSSQTKTYGVTLKLSTTIPTRTNYSFLGWATSASGSVAYAAGANYTTNANVTLYAVWSLNYTKPRITGFAVSRCDGTGTASEDGTYVRVVCTWSTDRSVSSITLSWTSSSTNPGSLVISASGTSGSINSYYGGPNCVFDADVTYTFTITVTDSGGTTSTSASLSSATYPMDVMPDGKGVAFGKAAEKSNYVDLGWPLRIRGQSGYELVHILSSPGWYRIGMLKSVGLSSCAARITIGGDYNNRNPEITEVHAYGSYSHAALQLVCSSPYGEHYASTVITEIRMHRASGSQYYIDVYYNLSATNTVAIIVDVMQGEFIPQSSITAVDISSLTASASRKLTSHWIYDYTGGGVDIMSNSAIRLYGGSSSNCVAIVSDRMRANANDQKYLGDSSNRWKAVYAVNGTIQTSDRNQKTDISEIDQKYIDLFDRLTPVTFKFSDKKHDRVHVGFIAQDVKTVMDELDISPEEFAAYCRDEKIETKIVEEVMTDEKGNEYTTKSEKDVPVLDENGNPIYLYSLRYTEFIALNTRMIQENRRKIAEQQNEIDILKQELAEIKALLKGDTNVTEN